MAGGVYASKPRPAVVLQDDAFATAESVTVAPMTSHLLDAPLMRLRVEADAVSALSGSSDVMIDKITTVWRSNVQSKVGRLSSRQLLELERLVMTFLGLAR